MMSHIEMEYVKTLKQVSQLERELVAEKEWVRQLTNSNARLKKFLVEAQAQRDKAVNEAEPEQEYICKCGLRVVPHQCKTDKEF